MKYIRGFNSQLVLQSSSLEKKLVKPLKYCFFVFLFCFVFCFFFWGGEVQFAPKRGHYGPRPKWQNCFLAEITKADHQLPETIYFMKISYVLTEL